MTKNILKVGEKRLVESVDEYIHFKEYYRVWLDKIIIPDYCRLQDILFSPAFDVLFSEDEAFGRSEELNGNPIYRIRNQGNGKLEITRMR